MREMREKETEMTRISGKGNSFVDVRNFGGRVIWEVDEFVYGFVDEEMCVFINMVSATGNRIPN